MNGPLERSQHDVKLLWLRAHRGIFRKVAREVSEQTQIPRSESMVRKVYWGQAKSNDGAIERALERAGAPGIIQR